MSACRDLHNPGMGKPRPRKQKDSLGLGVLCLSGCRDLNSGPHGPEPVSVFWNCSPHGLVIFHSREDTLFGEPCGL
jgi:hypothetical protein